MDDGFVLSWSQYDVLLLEKPVQVLPIVQLMIQFETVVKLVHLELLGVVAAHDFSIDPSIGQVSLRIRDFVCEV